MMDRLSGGDSVNFALEAIQDSKLLGQVFLLPTGSAARIDFDAFQATIAERARMVPRMRRRVQMVPLGIDNPILVDDPRFDPREHIMRTTVPPPGGPRDIAHTVAQLKASPLRRDRPLWQMWLLEGIADERLAIFLKSHHALWDGVTLENVFAILFDRLPATQHLADPHLTDNALELPRSSLALFITGLGNLVRRGPSIARLPAARKRRNTQVAQLRSRRHLQVAPPPSSVLNARVPPVLVWAYGAMPLDDLHRVRRQLGATHNELMLSIIASAVRRILADRGTLPAFPLVAMVPFSTHNEASRVRYSGSVKTMRMSLATDLADPMERLHAIQASSEATKAHFHALRAMHVSSAEALPPVFWSLLFKTMRTLRVAERRPPGSVGVSNIGTRQPLWCRGVPIDGIFSIPPLPWNSGLAIALLSYRDHTNYGISCHPALIGDPWVIEDAMKDAFREYAALAVKPPLAASDR